MVLSYAEISISMIQVKLVGIIMPNYKINIFIAIAQVRYRMITVVGSLRWGMAEMIEDGVSGFLGDPEEPLTFAEKLILAVKDAKLRESMGQATQQRVFEKYRPEVIIPQQLSAYQKAIEQFRHSSKA